MTVSSWADPFDQQQFLTCLLAYRLIASSVFVYLTRVQMCQFSRFYPFAWSACHSLAIIIPYFSLLKPWVSQESNARMLRNCSVNWRLITRPMLAISFAKPIAFIIVWIACQLLVTPLVYSNSHVQVRIDSLFIGSLSPLIYLIQTKTTERGEQYM